MSLRTGLTNVEGVNGASTTPSGRLRDSVLRFCARTVASAVVAALHESSMPARRAAASAPQRSEIQNGSDALPVTPTILSRPPPSAARAAAGRGGECDSDDDHAQRSHDQAVSGRYRHWCAATAAIKIKPMAICW